ncbi:MAG: cyclic nucleotide-binding domain-containing protein [Burkholderiales bacterium]|nr:cyclic nucleotide-binding domain-containing protein [Burkholderiales bacterium]
MVRDLLAQLRDCELCRRLAPQELEALAAIAERLDLPAGGRLFDEGDAGDGLYLLLSGEVEVSKRTRTGARPLARLGAGSVLGEISLLTAEPRSASVRAVAPTVALRLPAARFAALLAAGSEGALKIVAAIAEVLARRLAATSATLVALSERLEETGGRDPNAKEEKLAELHRALRVWSF